jgi:hypothetical protein
MYNNKVSQLPEYNTNTEQYINLSKCESSLKFSDHRYLFIFLQLIQYNYKQEMCASQNMPV